jgi:hypothetical protein
MVAIFSSSVMAALRNAGYNEDYHLRHRILRHFETPWRLSNQSLKIFAPLLTA